MERAQTLPRMFLVGGVRLKVKQGVKDSGGCINFLHQEGPGSECHLIFCMLPLQTLTLTQISSDSISHSVSTLNL